MPFWSYTITSLPCFPCYNTVHTSYRWQASPARESKVDAGGALPGDRVRTEGGGVRLWHIVTGHVELMSQSVQRLRGVGAAAEQNDLISADFWGRFFYLGFALITGKCSKVQVRESFFTAESKTLKIFENFWFDFWWKNITIVFNAVVITSIISIINKLMINNWFWL